MALRSISITRYEAAILPVISFWLQSRMREVCDDTRQFVAKPIAGAAAIGDDVGQMPIIICAAGV